MNALPMPFRLLEFVVVFNGSFEVRFGSVLVCSLAARTFGHSDCKIATVRQANVNANAKPTRNGRGQR